MIPPSEKVSWRAEQEKFLRAMSAETHFFRAFDGLPDVFFFVKNRRGELLFCSSNLPQRHGFSDVSELIGKTDHDLTPGPMAERFLRDDAIVIETGEPLPPRIETWLDEVGLSNAYRICKYPVKDRQGQVIGVMGTLQPAAPEATNEPVRDRLAPAALALEKNLEEFPGIGALAKICHLSERQFQRVFREAFGASSKDYWMRLRIRAACDLIRKGRHSLSVISAELGFYDQSNFSKHFRKHIGKTPMAYSREISAAPDPRQRGSTS